MSLDLSQARAVIFVFAQPDCPACHEFTPVLLSRIRARAGQGLVICDGSCPLQPGQIPVFLCDVTSEDTALQDLVKTYKVEVTPTMVLLLRGPGSCKLEGTVTAFQMDQVLDVAIGTAR